MYNLEEIQSRKEELQQAVLHARPFKPLYVKMKVFYGCNLKCEMCNHWRDTREPPISSGRFREVSNELAELGTKKIHISGGEPMLRPQVPVQSQYDDSWQRLAVRIAHRSAHDEEFRLVEDA